MAEDITVEGTEVRYHALTMRPDVCCLLALLLLGAEATAKPKPGPATTSRPAIRWVKGRSPLSVARYELLGLTPDGQKLAYKTWGMKENSGMGWASAYVVDVPRSAVLASVDDDAPGFGPGPSAAFERKVASMLSQAGIDRRARPRLLAQRSPKEELAGGLQRARFSAGGAPLELTVAESASVGSSRWCPRASTPTLTLHDLGRRTSRAVLRDRRIPSPVYCPRDFRIRDVYLVGRAHLAVVLDFVQPSKGAGGGNQYYFIVTCSL